MMTPKELRWIEMQFYFIMWDIWRLHNNFRDILNFVKCVKIFNDNFDESLICSITQEALMTRKLQINKDEYVILTWINRVPLKAVQKYGKIHKRTLGMAVERYTKNPDIYYFAPRNSTENVMQMKNFLEAVKIMKEVGLAWTEIATRNSGKYLNR